MFQAQLLGILYREDFRFHHPASPQHHLQQVSASMVAMEVTEQFKRGYPTAGNVTMAEEGGPSLAPLPMLQVWSAAQQRTPAAPHKDSS